MKGLGKKALKILGGVAPLVASAIGGPFAGPALAIVSKITGISEDKVDDFILSASPDELLQLKDAELEFDKWRIQAGIQVEEIEAKDRDSARSLAKEKGVIIQSTLSAVFIGGYFYMAALLITSSIADDMTDFQKGQIGILIGVLTAAIPQILAFWFGSSRGSKEKTEVLAARQ